MTRFKSRRSFTLIELLVVLAIVAILSTVVIMTLNPAELLKQARDSNRLSDLSTLNTALAAYTADVTNGFMGTSSYVYVSIPDTSSVCANLGLPVLPSGWSYNCVTATSTRLINGRGWIPVNLSNISFGSPLSSLPVDPMNTTTTGNYYTYVSGGSFVLTAIPESSKQKTTLSANPNISNYPGVIALGNNLSLSPLYNPDGLVGYWKFDEGSGSTVADSSGMGNNGTWQGVAMHYVAGKVGNYAGLSNGGGEYLSIPNSSSTNPLSSLTMSAWVNSTPSVSSAVFSKSAGGKYQIIYDNWCNPGCSGARLLLSDGVASLNIYGSQPTGEWRLITGVYNGASSTIYVNGRLSGSGSVSLNPLDIMNQSRITPVGSVDDVRLYNRALSAAEILALYNSTK